MRAAIPGLAVVAVLVAGCGTKTIRPAGAARSVVDVVSRQTGFRPTDVTCPSGVKAKVGTTFDCRFTGPEPRPYVAHMRIATVQGERVEFVVDSEPTG